MKQLTILCLLIVCGIVIGCSQREPQYVVITATPIPLLVSSPSIAAQTVIPNTAISIETTLLPTLRGSISTTGLPLEYIVQPGDTLLGIASSNGVSLDALLELNELTNPNILSVGQVIRLPAPPSVETSAFQIIPDHLFVRGPSSTEFSMQAFVGQQPGYIRMATDLIDGRLLSASEVISRVSTEFSVDPRLLLVILEYRSRWLSQKDIQENWQLYPIQGEAADDGIDRSGLYRQLAWAANQLNRGYYWAKYSRNFTQLELLDGTRLRISMSLNAATVGIQYVFGLLETYAEWNFSVTEMGFSNSYHSLFGNPFDDPLIPLVPPNLAQPELTLPFAQGETWFFTGGPHGGWGSGSAWAAIDFAPPDERPVGSELCYVSDYWATAVANGVIARSDDGAVVLDLDGDRDERTGWTIFYLHIADEDRVSLGSIVRTGDRIGHPSCEGGFSNATHMHIGRRYNGEWLPSDCSECPDEVTVPRFEMSGWETFGINGQEYQGFLINGNEQRTAEQGRLSPINRVSW
jgi:LasA protease